MSDRTGGHFCLHLMVKAVLSVVTWTWAPAGPTSLFLLSVLVSQFLFIASCCSLFIVSVVIVFLYFINELHAWYCLSSTRSTKSYFHWYLNIWKSTYNSGTDWADFWLGGWLLADPPPSASFNYLWPQSLTSRSDRDHHLSEEIVTRDERKGAITDGQMAICLRLRNRFVSKK